MDVCYLLLAIAGVAATVEVHFENRGGGFFLKHSPRTLWSSTVADLASAKAATAAGAAVGSSAIGATGGVNAVAPSPPGGSTVLSVDRFTVFMTSQPVSVRATYGPFSTKQTVPARSLVPVDEPPTQDARNFTAHGLDVSAHLVRPDIPRDAPVLRVLFHTGGEPAARRRLCILLHATLPGRPPLSAACSPDGEDGVCLVQLTIPAVWWPPLPPPDKNIKPPKTPQRLVQVAYSVLEPRGEKCVPRVQIQPVTHLGAAPLVAARANYREVRADDVLSILLPHAPLYPLSHLHVPVFLLPKTTGPAITAFVLRARVKSGLRILGVEASTDGWNVTADVNLKQKIATVTCVRKETPLDETEVQKTSEEILTWLLEVVEDGEDLWDGGRVVWSAQYYTQGKPHHHHHRAVPEENSKKLTARLEIQKDDIQSVLPISKNWELINTAVLTGHQVSQAMKVLIVSQAGKVADVTLQSSCHSEDESVLKVSSSCSSVYVDGSELRGSSNASILVKYGTYTGLAEFLVWMPEFPLELNLPDVRLSQVKAWRVPETVPESKGRRGVDPLTGKASKVEVKGWSFDDNLMETDTHTNCRLRFQQTPIEVYARFLAEDHESGRVSYFANRRTWLRVTDLVLSFLRVSDPRIASLHGRVVQGRSVGRTEVQVLSPITGRVIGAKEVRVGNDKVTLVKLAVQVVSGLQLSISPDSSIENGYIAETSVTRKLTAQYQEGLLDIELEWSDSTKTALRQVDIEDYNLMVDSLDPETVAFAPMVASHHPRVIAVGEGRGELLRVALLSPEECRRGTKALRVPSGPLAETTAAVEVDFGAGEMPGRTDVLQNDGHSPGRDRRLKSDLADILRMSPIKDENNHEPTVQARQLHGTGRHRSTLMTPLEIGMYVLLAAFCFAIVVFVVSCVVYASKFKPQPTTPMECALATNIDARIGPESRLLEPPLKEATTDARDWVWLGRSTLDRSTAHKGSHVGPHTGQVIPRITENPLANARAVPVEVEELPPSPTMLAAEPVVACQLNTATFSKSGSGRRYRLPDPWATTGDADEDDTPPPVPPHGAPLHALPPEPETDQAPLRKHRHHHHRGREHKTKDAGERHPSGDRCGSAEAGNVPTPKKHHKHRRDSGGADMKHHRKRSVDLPPELPDPAFVEFPQSQNSNRNSGIEVKKANIVVNQTYGQGQAEDAAVGLDDLNLGMNYDQIMHYFDNLKESNA